MSIELYPSVAKIKRNGVYENLPGFVPETGSIATQQMIATSESSATAQYVHNKGEYFRLNDTLYQAIVKINVGDAIVVGTNCEVAVLGNDVTHIANSIAAYELGIATAPHSTGEYFMVGETLYVATDDIQVGDSLSTSTNCRIAVVGDELSKLQTTLMQTAEYQINATIESQYMAIDGTLTDGGSHITVPVIKGEVYSIKCNTGIAIKPYVLISNNTVIDYFTTSESYGTAHDYDIEYIVPASGTLYVSSVSNRYIGIKKHVLEIINHKDVKENTDTLAVITEKNITHNLFDKSQYNLGYRSGNSYNTSTSYAYSKPIFLLAGSYLYTSVKGVVGDGDRVYFVDEYGNLDGTGNTYYIAPTEIGTVTQNAKYSSRTINKFTLTSDRYISLNLGYVRQASTTSPQISNFMLVSGSSLSDFLQFEFGYGNTPFLSDKSINGLSGLFYKTAIFDGDSISAGDSVGAVSEPTYKFGWGGRIGNANYMNWINCSVGGGVITSASNPNLTNKHSVVDNIDLIYASYPNLDYYIFEGGTNDADLIGNALTDPTILGTLSQTDFSGTYDITTFTGAMETICFKAIQYWKGKHIGYVVAPKMGLRSTAWDAETVNRRAYFERAIEVCKKWGIPVINLWDNCYLNPANSSCYNSSLDAQGNRDGGYMYTDGQHLTSKGYDYISPMIEEWMKTL